MTELGAPARDAAAFRDELVAAGLLVPTGVAGIYGRSAAFERVRTGVEAAIAHVAEPDEAEQLRFPPVVPRRHLEDIGYLRSFPHLVGTIFAFEGGEAEVAEQESRAARHEDWSEFQHMTDLALLPAACYPVYPMVAGRGAVPPGGVRVHAGGVWVFRREPSDDPARLQMFHQCEHVCIADPTTVVAWRDAWRERAAGLVAELGLEAEEEPASDPFFGRTGRLLAVSQREQTLKLELGVPVSGPARTAVASFNYHQEHFATTFGLELAGGGTAHSACVGFGEERIALALFRAHGLDTEAWPHGVRDCLWAAP